MSLSDEPANIFNTTELWRRFQAYHDNMSKAELFIIRNAFYAYNKGNDIEEFGSSCEAEDAFEKFKAAWIMGRIFQ